MSGINNEYNLLISCPSDTETFIGEIECAVNTFNNCFGQHNNIYIRPSYWRNSVYPNMDNPPQENINKQLVNESDLAIGLFWTRFGTPTEKYDSGVQEEIEGMLSRGKQVFLYFLDFPVAPSSIDCEQYMKVKKFKEDCHERGLYSEITEGMNLYSTFLEHLMLYFNSIINGSASQNTKKKILWVDDRPENNIYERERLEWFGLEFTLASSTKEALSTLVNQKFSLIISDMERDGDAQAGYSLLKLVKKSYPELPFIIYTGSLKAEDIKKVLNDNGQGYTNSPTELLELIKNLLEIE